MRAIPNYLRSSLLLLAFGFFFFQAKAQEEISKKQERASKSLVSKAESAKSKGDFAHAEADYRRALSKNQKNAVASYNFGHLYGDYDLGIESMNQLLHTIKTAEDKSLRHKAFHNLGNAYMNQEDYAQAVNAYKDALRNNPTDDETRYNLALAKEMMEEHGEDGDDNDQEDDGQNEDDSSQRQNQDNQEGQQEQEDQNQDQQDSDDDQEDSDQDQQDEGENEDEDDGNDQDGQEDEDNQDDNNQERPVAGQDLSDEQVENLLRAVENLEKDIQKRLNEEKKGEVIDDPNQKDW